MSKWSKRSKRKGQARSAGGGTPAHRPAEKAASVAPAHRPAEKATSVARFR
jgi:hypothetical protein